MAKEIDDPHGEDGLCIHCLSARVSSSVLAEFTESYPDVKMSWDAWLALKVIIEDEIKDEFGHMTEPEIPDVTVQ